MKLPTFHLFLEQHKSDTLELMVQVQPLNPKDEPVIKYLYCQHAECKGQGYLKLFKDKAPTGLYIQAITPLPCVIIRKRILS